MLSFGLLLLVVATNLLLAAFVFINNSRASLNRILSLLSAAIAGWSLISYFEDTNISSSAVHLLVKLDFLFGSAMIMLFFWFCYYLTKAKNKPLFWANAALASICSLLSLAGLMVKVYVLPDHIEYVYQSAYFVFLAYLGFGILGGLGLFVFRYRKTTGRERSQLQYVLLGLSLTSFAIILTNILLPNIVKSLSPSITRLGIYSALFLTGSMAYAIIKHHFMDIRLVVARSVAYGLLLTTLAGIYAGAVFSISKLFFVGNNVPTGQNITNIVIAVMLAGTFQPLKRFFEKITDSIFYRDHYDPQALLSDLSTVMAREIELVHLTDKVINILVTKLKLSKALIVVMDDEGIFYEANKESINFRSISIEELKVVGSGIVIKDSLQGEEIPELFNKYGLNVSVGLHSTNELVGFLLLGEKRNGSVYNDSDIKTLRILAQELAIAIHNARSYTQIQDFNKTLQQRVEEATAQLRLANDNLKKMDGVKNEFLSMATHQLNTPLSVVDGYLTMLNDIAHGKLTEEQHEFTQKALHRVRLMKRLVTDFLNVSRLETGKFSIEAAPVDLNKVVSEEVNELGPTSNEKEVLLQYMAPKRDVPIIEIDEQKTRQAIMNLIDNAIHYTPKGEVKVYLEADDKNITFKVVDNGIGVPENQKGKLFQKFSRGDNAKKERPSGSGVGLYLVKRVIEDQGGSVIFESMENKGSTFGFRLPIKTPASEQAEIELEPVTPEEKELEAIAAQKPKETAGSYYKIIG
jgi:signal transduction histidine kinase